MRTWILTGSPENHAATRERGYRVIGLKERNRRRAEEIEPGDRVVLYATRVMAFAGAIIVTGGLYEDREKIWPGKPGKADAYPWRFATEPEVVLDDPEGWVPAADVTVLQTDYRVTVSIGRHEIRVLRGGKAVLTAPVGIGTGATPTPGGVFYIKELLKPPDPKGAYGPYAYGLSGYSTVLNEFLGGDGEIGIHGTNDPSSVGRSVSHGCIRLRNADITTLAKMLPLGVPVQIEK